MAMNTAALRIRPTQRTSLDMPVIAMMTVPPPAHPTVYCTTADERITENIKY